MNEIIKQSTELYYEIDDCITRLLKARLDKDANKENEAIYCMESLLVSTMQHISWIVGELKDNSKIKWQTGEPQERGTYLISIKGLDSVYVTCTVYTHAKGWRHWRKEDIIAWCKLSDIKPYEEEK